MNVVLLANMRGEQDKDVCHTLTQTNIKENQPFPDPTPHPNPNCNTEPLLMTAVHCTVFNTLTNVTVDGFQMLIQGPTSGGQARQSRSSCTADLSH